MPAPYPAVPRRNLTPEEQQALWSQGSQGLTPSVGPMSLADLVMEPAGALLDEADVSKYLLPLSLLGMVKGPKKPAGKELIKDWKWRSLKDITSELNLRTIPEHVKPFGAFMQEQAAKASAGELTPRDLIKAFTITRASIQRGAIGAEKAKAAGLPIDITRAGQTIRPEGAFAEWLQTPHGQNYLNAAEQGLVDEDAIANAVQVMKPFGKADQDIPDALRWAAANLPGKEKDLAPIIAKAAQGGKAMNQWRSAVEDFRGIGLAKQGFVGSLLGYGQLPTLDARQIKLHTGAPTSEAQPFLRKGSGRAGQAAVDRLAARQQQMNVEMPSEMQPYYQHLTHHAVWDKVADEATTHEDLIRAMRVAGLIGGAVTLSDLMSQPQPSQQAIH